MPIYNVDLVTMMGERQNVKVEGDSLSNVRQQLEQQGNLVVNIKSVDLRSAIKTKKINTIIFVHELRTLLLSGLSLPEALDILIEHHTHNEDNPIKKIRIGLNEGLSLSEAMRNASDDFPVILIATVAASERNGTLVKALNSYIKYDEQVSVIKNKVYNASMYPLTLVCVALLVVFFLIIYLVPRFGAIYEGIDIQLPLASALMLKFGAFVGQYRLYVIIFMILLVIAFILKVKRQGLEKVMMSFLSIFSPLRVRLEIMYLSRFYRGLALLLESGASVVQSFNMMESLLLPEQQMKLKQAKEFILQGKSLSLALDSSGLTTKVSSRLLNAGDKNGEIIGMFEKSAEFHDLDLTQFVEKFSKLLEPILMLLIGSFIGLIVVLLYMPIFGLASGLQS
ncbi:type II secretion system F family protein [Acinetobacter courvalinii]|uniref:type II secretion system F family protein n=1 Tax=Acinetobacter courvalinii TaxID=280147 RepID=UPI003A8A981F